MNEKGKNSKEPKNTNKSWDTFGKSKGCFVINDPKLML